MGLEYVVEPAVGSAVQTVLDLVKVFKFGLSLVNCQDMNKSNLFLSFVTNSDFMIPISLLPNNRRPQILHTIYSVGPNSLQHQGKAIKIYIYIKNRTFYFVPKIQFFHVCITVNAQLFNGISFNFR